MDESCIEGGGFKIGAQWAEVVRRGARGESRRDDFFMELISLQGRETESFKVHRRAIDAKPPLKVFYLKISRTALPPQKGR